MKVKKLSILALIVIALITTGAISLLPTLTFNYDFESYFPKGDGDLDYYLEFREQFETDNDFILIGLEREDGIFDQLFLTKADALADSIAGLARIVSVASPTQMGNPVVGPFGVIEVPFIHVDDPSQYPQDSVRIARSKQMLGTLVAKDFKAICLYAKNDPLISKDASDSLLMDLNRVLDQSGLQGIRVTGRINGQSYYIEKMKFEMGLFILTSLVLLIIFLWFSFRSGWGIWVPIAVVVSSAIWLLALMALMGKEIDLMITLLPTILFVVGISDVVHIVSKYLEELRNGLPKMDALKLTFREIGWATFLTSLSTAIGFMTLLTASISPIKEFGGYTAVGVFIAYLLAFTMLPAVLTLLKTPNIAGRRKEKIFWYKQLHRVFAWVIKRPGRIALGGLTVLVLGIVGCSLVRIDNFLLEDLKEDDPYLGNFFFFEKKFGGVRPFEMAIWTPDSSSLLDYDRLKEQDELEAYLEKTYGVNNVFSPLALVKLANQAMNGGNAEHYVLPAKDKFESVERVLKKFRTSQMNLVIAPNQNKGRISGRIIDGGGRAVAAKDEALEQFVVENGQGWGIQYRLTGMGNLIDKNSKYLSTNMMMGLLFAFGIVALLMGVLYRSIRIVFIALIPNMLPLILIGAVMGFTGIDLGVSTSIVFTIAFGIAVDDTIHFMSKFKMELNKGQSLLYALKRTYMSTGKAILVTTVILCSGFLTLVFSSFTSTFHVGYLITLALAFAVIADLLLLPALIILFYRKK